MSEQFEKFLGSLEIKVASLIRRMHRITKEILKSELNTCRAFLSNLHTYALQHQVDLDAYYDRISAIHDGLVTIQEEIERQPWWQKLLSLVRKTIVIVLDLLGLPNISGLLSAPDDPLLLN